MIVATLEEREVKRERTKDDTKLKIIRMVIGFELLAGGMMMARNIPKRATDKAETIRWGRMLPITMPMAVPRAQQGAAKLMAP